MMFHIKRFTFLLTGFCYSLTFLALTALSFDACASAFPKIQIVAAENFYGDVAQQLGGARVQVVSILSNPDQDPHLFEADPQTARQLQRAQLVIANGADYDPWLFSLLKADPVTASRMPRKLIVVADLVHRGAGDNPHLWYAPQTMPALALALEQFLSNADPVHAAEYAQRYRTFIVSLRPLQIKIAQMRKKFAGQPVTATEPVFGYMAHALGLTMRNERFQLAVMNGTDPGVADVAAFEADLKNRRVKALLYNAQAVSPLTLRLQKIAQAAGIPAVQITETQPANMNYQRWMMSQLHALDAALAVPRDKK